MFALVAALAQVGGILIDKIILTRRQMEIRVYVPILFLFLVISTGILYPYLGKINSEAFQPYYLFLFFLMLVVAIFWNIFYYRGVQSEKVHDYEIPLLTILLATIFLKGERNVHIFIAAIIAGIALVTAHLRKAHLEVSSGTKNLVLAVILMSVELIILDILLKVYSPVALYFFRTGLIFIFFYFYFRPYLNKVSPANMGLIISTAFLGTLQMITKFYGFQQYQQYGVVYTSLVLILSPVIVYIGSTIFLHEKIKFKTVVSLIVILAAIVYATIFGK
ncbi:MAG: hypothetical protein US94_C0033G0014 [Berkelbacteria bacterium GW2011_GWB1_38_5]|uniref:EamA domain-containing protein n=1 Tax=Berkelbacteria bacterium GW2011_GWB1_38_5 TaxID=1618336 RepID=A0A0G0N8W4_9BACT|nr:MAG: hypothetical protein US94_C0033G0014 [Berkelbacteria bacterium GW2011_GWB1_38_5]